MRDEASCQVIVPLRRDEVFSCLADVPAYPRWMRDVLHVRPLGRRGSKWVLYGPRGTMRWEVETTVDRRPGAFAWCARGPDMAASMRFQLDDVEGGRTRLRATRFFGVAGVGSLRSWWGDDEMRLRTDIQHLVEELRRRAGPRPVATHTHRLGAATSGGLRPPTA